MSDTWLEDQMWIETNIKDTRKTRRHIATLRTLCQMLRLYSRFDKRCVEACFSALGIKNILADRGIRNLPKDTPEGFPGEYVQSQCLVRNMTPYHKSREYYKFIAGDILVEQGFVYENPWLHANTPEQGTVGERYMDDGFKRDRDAGLQRNPGILADLNM